MLVLVVSGSGQGERQTMPRASVRDKGSETDCLPVATRSLVLDFPGSSYGWFSIPSKSMNKGNGKNLATHRVAVRQTNRFLLLVWPIASLTAVLLRSAIRG
jgi:hypothetical protein